MVGLGSSGLGASVGDPDGVCVGDGDGELDPVPRLGDGDGLVLLGRGVEGEGRGVGRTVGVGSRVSSGSAGALSRGRSTPGVTGSGAGGRTSR
ncbi:hypothetical protein [Nocardioides daphniae]|uniref:Uncharacterized protein n=1 Tax=Nocardioides daphniae TaxID=402297 RepID=A0A4P7U9H9_9ACTN|nr:hypothetical protein [Nocardioides daphniae]QCC76732.1 hypothetical protein E2C04_04955 [Nocardioides daphniae]GGD15795.1 hypothetical protein GCM10007231_13520 [Nocardioides daphniae]